MKICDAKMIWHDMAWFVSDMFTNEVNNFCNDSHHCRGAAIIYINIEELMYVLLKQSFP